ncbi:endoxylanase [Emericellopsis cladophorae]|uniref:Endoxylanase n=1 Tax=Emericellopsis cladophorae TaxID=2686198 RepID=A0A9Q0BI63_9HYPO|nr:endoxylanase [Emericellopsis cladophorae]KAI6785495.1 endoxylanase [Emericellopsis cladophorae]
MGSAVQGALEQLASAPVDEVAIMELDIAQAPSEDYTAVVQACLNIEKCRSITVWGVSDAVSLWSLTWIVNLANTPEDSWRQGDNPLLFDGSFNAKPAYDAILNIL